MGNEYIYLVVWNDYDAKMVDSVWVNEQRAQQRAAERRAEGSEDWDVDTFILNEPDGEL